MSDIARQRELFKAGYDKSDWLTVFVETGPDEVVPPQQHSQAHVRILQGSVNLNQTTGDLTHSAEIQAGHDVHIKGPDSDGTVARVALTGPDGATYIYAHPIEDLALLSS